MKNLVKGLKDLAQVLNKAKANDIVTGFALIGGVAVSARAVPRATKDVDFLVSASKDFFDEVLPKALASKKYTTKVFKGDKLDPLNGLVRIYDAEGNEMVDLIPVFFKWQAETIQYAENIEVFGTTIPVARVEDLIVMKLLAGGPQDLLDIQSLLKATKKSSLDQTRLFDLAKRTRVDKKLARLLSKN